MLLPPPASTTPPPGRSSTATPRTTPRTSTTPTFLSNLPPHVWQSLVIEADLQLSLLTQEGRLLRGIHKKVDSSDEAMDKAFDVLDRQGTGYLDHDQFVEGLNRCLLAFGGTTLPKDLPSLETLWAGASAGSQEGTRRISREAFGLVIRRLKMEVLLPPIQPDMPASPSSRSTATPGGREGISGGGASDNTDDDLPAPPALGAFRVGMGVPQRQQTMLKHDQLNEDVVMKVFDFTKHSMYKRDVLEGKQRDFFLTKHVPDIILKWIVVKCHDYTNILRLAVKYCFHNLHLEDVLKLETQKPKVTYHGGNHFVIIPTLRLTRETDKALQAWLAEHHDDVGIGWGRRGRRMTPFPIMLEEATAGVFSAGPPENDNTVITVRTSWRTVNNKTGIKMAMRKVPTTSSSSSSSSSSPSFFARALSARQASGSDRKTGSGRSKSLSNVAAPSQGIDIGGIGRVGSMKGGVRQRPHEEGHAASSATLLGNSSQQLLQSTTDGPTSLPLKDLLSRNKKADQQGVTFAASGQTHKDGKNTSARDQAAVTPPRVHSLVAGEASRTLRESGLVAGGETKAKGYTSPTDAAVAAENAAVAEDWADIFDPTAPDFDDSSVTTALDEEDKTFDMQMMHEVADSVYHTNGTVVGNTSQWLVHSILDHTVDRLVPIVEAYQIRVSYFQDMLHQNGANFGKAKTKAVMDTKLDLLWLQRRVALLKPILRQLMRTAPPELQLYYQDVDDHLERCLEGLSGLGNMAQSIIDEAHHHREERINEILLFITVITSIFTPASFLAGVFGMNFQAPEGGPGMPELKWEHGYLWFWLWSFLLSGGVLACVRYKVDNRIRWCG